jgi:iron complex outermembrane receptor protein
VIQSTKTRVFGCASALALLVAAPALAQTAEPASSQTGQVDDIVVTASRVVRDGFQAPTPTTVVTAESLALQAPLNVADALNQLPALRPTLSPSATTSLSSHGGNYLDLRGLGATRTLVLVDRKRYVNSQVMGGVDIGQIPQALIAGVDVVTGGASAAWGSDAVAGVVNLRFDHSLEGFKGSIQGGISGEKDRENYLGSVAFGHRFLNDRAHVLLAGEISENNGIEHLSDRDWGKGYAVISNPAYTPQNDEPQNLFVSNARYANMSPGGVINSGPLRGTQFGPNGAPYAFQYGDLASSSTMVGGSGSDYGSYIPLEPWMARKSVYGRLAYDVTPSITAYAEASHAEFQYDSGSGNTVSSFTIRRDNAFLPSNIGAAMDANGISTFSMGRTFHEQYPKLQNDITAQTDRFVVGADGDLPGSWSWSAYATYGEAENDQQFSNNRLTARFTQAVDAIIDPASGNAICRSATARADGCVAFNPFGDNSVSDEAYAWVFGSGSRTYSTSQKAASFSINGEPISTWAGPVSLATGVEWRREEAGATSSERAINREFASYNTAPWNGVVEVKEVFAETVVPLAADQAWARSLDLNLAGRVTDYSTSGRVTTWKAGLTWELNDDILFRTTQSRDIRAPSLEELFGAPTNLYATVLDSKLAQSYSTQTLTAGNADLVPEEADTFTGGVVYRPSFAPGLKLSVDYYSIELTNAIMTFNAATIVDRCNRIGQLCEQLDRDPTTDLITYIRNTPQNLQSLETSGVDFEAAYDMPLFGGDLGLRSLISYVDKTTIDDGEAVTELAGASLQISTSGLGGVPNWRYNSSAVFKKGPATLGVTWRYIGGANVNNAYTSKNLNILEHEGQSIVDLSGSWDLQVDGRELELFGRVGNLFDEDPPLTGVSTYGTTRSLYEVIGRTFTAGMRFRF